MRKLLLTLLTIIVLSSLTVGFVSCDQPAVPGATAEFDNLKLRGNLYIWDGDSYNRFILPQTAGYIVASDGSLQISSAYSFTGTPTFANHASGSANITASSTSLSITHGLASTPTRVFLSWGRNTGTSAGSTALNTFSWTANATSITVTAAVSTNMTAACYWLAYIADE